MDFLIYIKFQHIFVPFLHLAYIYTVSSLGLIFSKRLVSKQHLSDCYPRSFYVVQLGTAHKGNNILGRRLQEEVKFEYYLLTNWLAYLYERIQSPRPDVMPDRREGITRATGFVFACIDTQAS